MSKERLYISGSFCSHLYGIHSESLGIIFESLGINEKVSEKWLKVSELSNKGTSSRNTKKNAE